MSGVEENLRADWKDRLATLRGQVPSAFDDEIGEIGGFKSIRNNRRGNSSTRRVIDPFGEEIVVKARRRDRSGKSEDECRGAETLFRKIPEDIGSSATENAIGEEEVPIMSKNSDQPSNDENPERDYSSTTRSRRSKAEGEFQEEYEQSPEEIEKKRKLDSTNASIKRVVKLGILSIGTLAVMSGVAAISMGLFGKHKSNIMNM
jgi:hypothetical protein